MNTSDRLLWEQLAESAIGRIAGSLLAAVTAARSESVAMRRANDLAVAWQRFTPSTKWQLIGIALGAAVATNLGLLFLQQTAGWWWWAIPALAGSFAVLVLALSMAASRTGVAD